MGKLEDLRAKHPTLTYQAAKYQLTSTGLLMEFEFNLADGPSFRPTNLIKGVTQAQLDRLDSVVLQDLVFQIGLVELLSYWKAACSPTIDIKAGDLSDDQLVFWQNLLVKGMGEYFFVNQIDFTVPNFVTWQTGDNLTATNQDQVELELSDRALEPSQNFSANSYLIPVGGGKDSIVSIELLKLYTQADPDIKLATLLVNPTPAAQAIAQLSQLLVFEIERKLDPQLLELNQQGYLNGHTPFSALLAFLSTLVAYVFNYQAVAVSNEQSANEESLHFLGHAINHQYSKSFEFEREFRTYISKNLTNLLRGTFGFPLVEDKSTNVSELDRKVMKAALPGRRVLSNEEVKFFPYYFSLLRPFTELKIAQLFDEMTVDKQEYRTTFVSCNRGGREGKWCGHCAKCLFAYIILTPFLGLDQVQAILGHDLLADSDLKPILAALIGLTDQKPLDCVGLRDESRAALYLIWQKYKQTGLDLPKLLSDIESTLANDQSLPLLADKLLSTWYQPDAIPADLATWLHEIVKAKEAKYVSS